jgi:hypothetical protein
MAWNLNKINWWRYPDEPFFTNCCPVIAYMCWMIWLVAMIGTYLIIIYALVGIVALAYFI